MGALVWIALILIVLAILVVLVAWFCERATNEVSLVRTGVSGRRVVIGEMNRYELPGEGILHINRK